MKQTSVSLQNGGGSSWPHLENAKSLSGRELTAEFGFNRRNQVLRLEKAGFILVFFSAAGKVQFEIHWHHSKADEVGRPLMIDPGSFWQHISLEPKHKENTPNLRSCCYRRYCEEPFFLFW